MSYDEYEHAFDGRPRARRPGPRRVPGPPRPRTPPGPGDRVAAVILLGVEGIVACGAYLQVILSGMFFDRCADPSLSCDYALGDAIITTALVAVPAIVGLSAVAVVLRSVFGRSAWWVPIAGSGALIAVAYATGGLVDLAVR